MNARRRLLARRRRPFGGSPALRCAPRNGAYILLPQSRFARLWSLVRGLEPSQAFGVAASVAFICYLLIEALR